jgi:5'-methylthioadenosine phosphorylase
MVTDFDCWHPDHDHVSVADVVRVMHANSANAKQLLLHAIPRIGADAGPCAHGCDRALEYAMLTPPEMRDPELVQRLDAVAGRVLRQGAAS